MPWMALVNSVRASAGVAYIYGDGEGCEVGEIRAPDVAGTRAPDVAGTPDVGGSRWVELAAERPRVST